MADNEKKGNVTAYYLTGQAIPGHRRSSLLSHSPIEVEDKPLICK